MNTDELEPYEKVKNERDALLSIVKSAQQRELEANRIIELLVLAGHVKMDRVDQARELAKA